MSIFEQNTVNPRQRLAETGLDIAVITDEDRVYYYAGCYDYLH